MTSNGIEDQDQRKILAMEDSSMTIEFLRARLLAERSVSQTARQRAEELAARVLELEEQLKIVSLQRKKAEKATVAVLSILENHGKSDASQDFDSGSDQEEICSDSKGAESAGSKNEQNPTSSDVKVKENVPETFSSSEIVSSPSTSRSLSWKSGDFSLQSFDRKKCTDSAWRRCSSFGSTGTSLPKRVGKSCRRIRRNSTRLGIDGLKSTSGECASGVLPSSANNGPHSLMGSTGNNDVEDKLQFPASEMSENQSKADERDEDMERALQHKAQLIGQYEAEEKAQREWEEKYRENNSFAQDSCDPGNYSDVTEERDDMKAFEQSYSTGMTNLENNAFQEADVPSTNGVTDSIKSSQHVDTVCWKDQNCRNIVNSEPPASESAFSKLNGTCPENHGLTPAYSRHQSLSANGSPMHPSKTTIAFGESSSQGGNAVERSYEQALVSHNVSNKIGSILGALEQAKFSLSQHIDVSPVLKDGSSVKAIEHSIPMTRVENRLDIPPGFPGLFRLPTDFQPRATTATSYQGFGSRLSSTNDSLETGADKFYTTPYLESGSNAITGNGLSSFSTRPFPEVSPGVPSQRPIFENTVHTVLPSSPGFNYLNPPSSLDLPVSSKSTYPTYPFHPVVVPNLSSGEEVFLRSLPRNETGIPQTFHVSHYDAHLRPHMYR